MTVKIFSDASMMRDAYPDLRVSDARQEVRGDHLLVITATRELGCDTGRRRYRVVCRSCHVLVHPATTGPQQQMDTHVRWFKEDGEPLPYPGTQIGVDE